MNAELLPTLQRLGFTEYEAKVYLALLRQSPLTGYAVAQRSGVPRSKVYEVLHGMVERGEVLVSYGEPTQYSPLLVKELIAKRRSSTEVLLQTAEDALEEWASDDVGHSLIWTISGREKILARMREVIGRAQKQILLEVWPEDAPEVRDALAAAAQRGVEITIIAYRGGDFPFAKVYVHDITERDDAHRGIVGRWMILAVDAREVVTGIVSDGTESQAAWSAHPGLAVPVTELLKHDLFIAEMLLSHRELLERDFGKGLIALRDQFSLATAAYARAKEPASASQKARAR
jgi:sugar-specific transcriptional regulator TrmB